MTKKALKKEFNESNLLLLICHRVCIALIVVALLFVLGAILNAGYDEFVFSEEIKSTGGWSFIAFIFEDLLPAMFDKGGIASIIVTIVITIGLVCLSVVISTTYNVKWALFYDKNKDRPAPPTPVASTAPEAPAVTKRTDKFKPEPVVFEPTFTPAPVVPPVTEENETPASEDSSAQDNPAE